MSRTALDGFPFGDIENDFMLDLIRRYAALYLVEILWNSLGYHIQTNNRHNFLSTDFGLKEFNPPSADKCPNSEKERIRRYRRYVNEARSLNRPEKGKAKVIKNKFLEKERKKDYELSRSDRFNYRTCYFTDSGIIGSKESVSSHYRRFKDLFMSKNEKIPKPVAGLDGIFSPKRLLEI